MTAETYWQRFHEATKEPTECDVLLHSDSSPGQELKECLITTRAQKKRDQQQKDSWSAGIMGAELVTGGGPESLEESGGSDAEPVSESLQQIPVDNVSDWRCQTW